MSRKFSHQEYTYQTLFGSAKHYWQIVGPVGAVHFHASVSIDRKYETSCGLEFHHSARAGMYKTEAPHHLSCPVLGEPCWHDGTSLYATESLWPTIERWLKTGDHESVFRLLEREYCGRFESESEDAP